MDKLIDLAVACVAALLGWKGIRRGKGGYLVGQHPETGAIVPLRK